MTRWTEHSSFTRPGKFAAELSACGPLVNVALEVVQGVLIHSGALEKYGLTDTPGESRETLPVEARLADVHARWAGPLTDSRPASARSVGTCRDFALLICAIMRCHAIPARVRCGFASYFTEAQWEDHWVCEVRIGDRWQRIDAQLDAIHRDWLRIAFDILDLPREVFMTADEAWRSARASKLSPETLGHGDARGLWFAYVNLVRDRLALADCLSSDWDGWRAVASESQSLSPESIALGDQLARLGDEGAPPLLHPWWL